ncbi:MAG: 2Fe-2S ferredoxin [Rhodobacteraceae bacterium]|nr:MAG: 2Fe-2S ferredoxin [Paracoccaceae bacterium]
MTNITFIAPDGTTHKVEATDGHSVMEVAIAHNIEGVVAECAGSLACSTCHVFVDEATAKRLGAPEEVENEMLDFVAVERRSTSRLSCQVQIDEHMENAVFTIPDSQV